MNRFLLLLFIFQTSLVVALAQITFTREWVTGKRAAATNAIFHRREPCVSFMPTIELLMDIEEMQRRECGGGVKFAVIKPFQNGHSSDGVADLHVKVEDEPGTFASKI